MITFLLITTITASVTQNCLFNVASKKEIKSDNQIYYYNTVLSLACIFLFGILLLLSRKMSLYSVLLGVLFGVISAMRNAYYMKTLANGPMNITLLITASSTIIPTLSGVFFGEHFSAAKLVFVFILIGFIYLSLRKEDNSGINKKWIFFAMLTFLFQGAQGILQKVHQTSNYKEEAGCFLFVTFIISYIYNKLQTNDHKNVHIPRKVFLSAAICGICMFAVNYLNLKLAGMLPSQLFFPLANGGTMIFSQIMSAVIFKERLSKKQFVGLVGGICALIAICIV